ncbi:hypothetical protein HZH68_017006 [Vespula germanica]|uniref:Uncharacterized protein n=1 Tax=Vespula germanica TaxID=30212 RepID=A0A834IY98_VESGE|nr:hypothetical protein HZH68_017006 [Vespula germanica]
MHHRLSTPLPPPFPPFITLTTLNFLPFVHTNALSLHDQGRQGRQRDLKGDIWGTSGPSEIYGTQHNHPRMLKNFSKTLRKDNDDEEDEEDDNEQNGPLDRTLFLVEIEEMHRKILLYSTLARIRCALASSATLCLSLRTQLITMLIP